VFPGCLLEDHSLRTVEARLSCGSLTTARLHGPHRESVVAIALFVFSGTLQASGQGITVTPAIMISLPQSVSAICSADQTIIGATGCASSHFYPLFNMQVLGSDWRQFLLGPNPPKFRETVHINVRQTCISVSDFAVDLSGGVGYSQTTWTPTPPVGPVCTNESIRVNTAASAVSVQTFQADANKLLDRFRLTLRRRQPLIAPACGRNRSEAQTALYGEIWALLNTIAQDERNAWQDPEKSFASQCKPQCALCTPEWTGWGGTITCTRTVRDTDKTVNYTWDETQTWIVGGTPQQQMSGMGGTIYPATLTAKGGGSKTGISWMVNETPTQGTLTVSGTQQVLSFQTSQTQIPITSVPTGYSSVETAYPVTSFPLTPNTQTIGSTVPPPGMSGTNCGNTPQKPATASCQVDCKWTLAFQ
jgi:hypothetical protein